MIIRSGGGSNGAKMAHYMETGEKQGRTLTRDELDSRIILDGDLADTARIIDDMHTANVDTERFLHLTFGFKEDHVSPEMYAAIAAEAKEFLLGGYQPGEVAFYAEAHDPKVKTEIDQQGKVIERKPHIHIIIPKTNNMTGEKEDPLGMLSARFGGEHTTAQILDAFQEHINHKYGLSSPKDADSRRLNFMSKADILERIDGHDFTGKNREWLQTIRDQMIAERVETPEAFRAMLEKFGKVTPGKEGQSDQYWQVKPFGEQKNVRLKDWQFTDEFITKPTAEKEAIIHQERVRRYIESQPGKPTPAQIAEVLSHWEMRRDEIRFIHTGSKLYAEKYKDASIEEKKEILAKLKEAHYAGVKAEFGYDDNQLTPQAQQEAQATQEDAYQAALQAAFPNRRLNASHLRDMTDIRDALAAGDAIIADPALAVDALTFSQSTITSRDLEKYLLKNTVDAEQYEAAMSAVLNLPELVVRQDENGNTTFTTTDIEQIERGLIETVERMAGYVKEPSREEIDAQLAAERVDAPVAERQPRRAAEIDDDAELVGLHEMPSVHDLPAVETLNERITREVAGTKSMNEGQAVAYKLLVNDNQIAVVNGAPGTGKSYILAAMREAEERKGNTVYGAILQGKTAEDLERDSGIKSTTMHSFLAKLDNGSIRLNSKSVVVVDEAGMVGSRQMAALLHHIESAGARLRLVGDVYQLHAVECGNAFKQISDRCEVASLTQIMRQKEEWQLAASEQLSRHELVEPLKAYHERGHIHFAADAAAANRAVVDKWNTYRTGHPHESLIVLVATNKERKQLNELMRAEIKKEGGLRNETDVFTDDGIRQMAVGERIMFTAGDGKLGVKNGTTGTISAIENGKLHITTSEGKRVELQANGANTEEGNKIDYFYAATVHKSQGMTQDHAITLISPFMALENTLVAMTRHKHTLDVVCNQQHFADLDALTKGLDRSGRKDFSHDPSKPEWKELREADNVVSQYKADFAHEQVIERAAKAASFAEVRDNLDARQLLDRLAVTHGVDTSIYGITKDDKGRDRIECGKRQLNVSDFLTKEIHLDYKSEAAPLLKATYAAQLEGIYKPLQGKPVDISMPGHEVNKPLWQQFMANKAERDAAYKTKAADLSGEHKERADAIRKAGAEQKSRIERTMEKYAEKRDAKKELRSTTADAIRALGSEIRDRRAELMQEFKKPKSVEYKDFLAERALDPHGEKYLAELRRVSLSKEDATRIDAIEKTLAERAATQVQPEVLQQKADPRSSYHPDNIAAREAAKEAAERAAAAERAEVIARRDAALAAQQAASAATKEEPRMITPEPQAIPEPVALTPEQQRIADSLADIQQQIAEALPVESKNMPVVEADRIEWEQSRGDVIAQSAEHVALLENKKVSIHRLDGVVTTGNSIEKGRAALAVGNAAHIVYKRGRNAKDENDIRPVADVVEKRKEHQKQISKERGI